MALVDFWNTNRAELTQKHVQQLIAIAGDGKLLDGKKASAEFRGLLSTVPSGKLSEYAAQCLEDSFDGSGFALQDIVNEIGRRLGFAVHDGLYRGRKGRPGHDGLWKLRNGHRIVVEVKTTDVYQINLETIASYRRILVEDGEVDQDSNSILIIVGRKDTSGLEAQIRGSRYAWDIRIITVEALVRLMGLRETLDDPGTVSQISGILIPKEYTKLDDIIDLVFDTAEEVATADEPVQEEDSSGKDGQQHHPKFTPAKFHDACIDRIEKHSQASFIKESRTVYRAPTQNIRVLVSVSRDHGAKPTSNYWFAFHPYQKEQLQEAKEAFVAFGCGSAEKIFLVPLQVLENHLQYSWITERDGRMYWHVRIRQRDGKHHWALKKGEKNIAIDKYLLP